MAEAAKAQEEIEESGDNSEEESPSMEDILSSIRGVISGDSDDSGEEPATAEDEGDEVLELTDVAEETKEDNSVLEEIDSALKDEEKNDKEAEAEAENKDEPEVKDDDDDDVLEAHPSEEDKSPKPANKESLLTKENADDSSGSLKKLVESLPKEQLDSPVTRSGTTLEDLVIEAIRPLLASWLNDNLPTIVKQLVEKEIKRLVPKDEDI